MLAKGDDARAFQEKADRLKADFQHAQQLGDQIREHNPHDSALRHELASLLLRLGKVEDALHWYGTASRRESEAPTDARGAGGVLRAGR